MEDQTETCPDCTASCAPADNYCRRCGMYLEAFRTATSLVPAPDRSLAAVRPALPAPVRRVATAVAVGAALQVGLGLATRYLAAQGAQKAARAAIAQAPAASRALKARPERRDPADDAAAVSETVIVRRVWIRRP